MWKAYAVGPDVMHIVPEADLVEHTTEEDCICGPLVDHLEDDLTIVTHVSLDGRERNEPDWK